MFSGLNSNSQSSNTRPPAPHPTSLSVLLALTSIVMGFATFQMHMSGGSLAAHGTIHYVKADATGSNNGTSWANAYTDLQSALVTALSDDEIWVATGIYKPTTGTDRTATFSLRDGVSLYGGFAGVEAERAERDHRANLTVLSGDLADNDNDTILPDEVTRLDNSYRVVTAVDIGTGTVLDGFTISGGNASEYPFDTGAGIFNERSHPTLVNVSLTRNSAAYFGGAMFNVRSSPTLTHTVLIENYAGHNGGAIANLSNSAPFIAHSLLERNSARQHGGAIASLSDSSHFAQISWSR